MDEVFTIPEAAREAKIGKSTLYLLAQRGEIPVVRIGRSVRVRRETLRRWISDHEAGLYDSTPGEGRSNR